MVPTGIACCWAAADTEYRKINSAPEFGSVGLEALVVLIQPAKELIVVVPAWSKQMFPRTSQSPAVRLMLVTLAAVPVVSDTALATSTVLSISSPTLPAAALSFVVVPMIPDVEEKEIDGAVIFASKI